MEYEEKKVPWTQRNKATNVQEAMVALADFLSSYRGIRACLEYKDRESEDKALSQLNRIKEAVTDGKSPPEIMAIVQSFMDPLDEAEEYARQWGIPFNRALTIAMVEALDHKHDTEKYNEGYWTPSGWNC